MMAPNLTNSATGRADDDLGFRRRAAVKWFSPPTLARSAAKVLLAAAFGDYLDKRELQSALPSVVHEIDPGADGIWIDFVADTGDGFDPTYSVAWCMAQHSIHPEGAKSPLPRADLVIFGGDEVYPYATPMEYHDRFEGPMTAALPWTQPKTRPAAAAPTQDELTPVHTTNPVMLAIPGNHDWYDGLTGFMRLFAQNGWIGGRRLIQRRSYFSLLLPGRNWLWGIDIQNDAYVDAVQLDYFRQAATKMAEDDRLIICTAKPSWIDVPDDPAVYRSDPPSYRNLKKIESLVPEQVRVVLMLSGDSHHYARYEADVPDENGAHRMKITAGGGGAFLSASHTLDGQLDIPRRTTSADPVSATEQFTLRTRYPSEPTSRRLSLRTLALPVRNWTFMPIPGLFYLLLFAATNTRLTSATRTMSLDGAPPGFAEVLLTFVTGPSPILILLLFGAIAGFYVIPKRYGVWAARIARCVVGLLQTLCHLLAQAWLATLILGTVLPRLPRTQQSGQTSIQALAEPLCGGVLMFILGSIVGSVIFAFFLCAVFLSAGWNKTEAFSAFRHTGYKNFLRMHVSEDGITVYPIGIDKTCRRWQPTPPADRISREDSLLRPKNLTASISTHLIEEPYRVH
jgi:hypothetical protein